jgi:hypothetical protein
MKLDAALARLKAAAAAAAKHGPSLAWDAAGLAGLVLISAGAREVYHPLGLIAPGVLLLAGAVLQARGRRS